MKYAVLFAALAIAPAAAQEKPLCVDASRNSAYNARPVSLHEVLARNSTGDMRGVRLGTTCIHVDRAATVGLHSLTQCIGKGDDVAALVDRQFPAPGADEKLDRVDAFPNGDRVALAEIVWSLLNWRAVGHCRAIGVAAREHRGAPDDRQQPDCAGAA